MKKFTFLLLICAIFTLAPFSIHSESVTAKLSGGSGKARIENPVEITRKDGKIFAKLVWSSKNFDYMIVEGKKYLNENEGGKSTFTVQISDLSKKNQITADTIAMSVPHEIEYLIEFEK